MLPERIDSDDDVLRHPEPVFRPTGCPIASCRLRKIGLSILIRRVLSSNESLFRISGCSSTSNKRVTFHISAPIEPLKANPYMSHQGQTFNLRHNYERTPNTVRFLTFPKTPRWHSSRPECALAVFRCRRAVFFTPCCGERGH